MGTFRVPQQTKDGVRVVKKLLLAATMLTVSSPALAYYPLGLCPSRGSCPSTISPGRAFEVKPHVLAGLDALPQLS